MFQPSFWFLDFATVPGPQVDHLADIPALLAIPLTLLSAGRVPLEMGVFQAETGTPNGIFHRITIGKSWKTKENNGTKHRKMEVYPLVKWETSTFERGMMGYNEIYCNGISD